MFIYVQSATLREQCNDGAQAMVQHWADLADVGRSPLKLQRNVPAWAQLGQAGGQGSIVVETSTS